MSSFDLQRHSFQRWTQLFDATKDVSVEERNKEYLKERMGFTEDRPEEMIETTNIINLDCASYYFMHNCFFMLACLP